MRGPHAGAQQIAVVFVVGDQPRLNDGGPVPHPTQAAYLTELLTWANMLAGKGRVTEMEKSIGLTPRLL